MYKNEEILKSFLNGKVGQGLNLITDGTLLINYKTILAKRTKDKISINLTKYSRTTSAIQNKLKEMVKDYYLPNQITYFKENNQDYIRKGEKKC